MGILSFIVLLPLAGAALIGATRSHRASRWIALSVSGAAFLASVAAALGAAHPPEHLTWIASLGVEFSLSADGLSLALLLLSTFISLIASIASPKSFGPGYWALLLLLQTGMSGTFAAADLFLFFVFWELVLLPMYFLIGIWGGARKEYAALKFFLFTLGGSVFLLVALIALHFESGNQTFIKAFELANPALFRDLASKTWALDPSGSGTWGYLLRDGHWVQRTFDIPNLVRLGQAGYWRTLGTFLPGIAFNHCIWWMCFIAFAVKVPVVPLHTWLPDAHVEAPTPVSLVLAGILLKMGIYGLIRINWAILPESSQAFSYWVALFGVVNVVYGALICLAQKDFKRLVAYSSVSHLGFSLLGLAAFTPTAFAGAALNLVTHGLISPMLFLTVGVLYDRTHHRNLDGWGGLAQVLPEYSGLLALALFASLGLPGLAGFVPEFLVLSGAFARFPWHTAVVSLSLVITAGYCLWTLQRIALGPVHPEQAPLSPLSGQERLAFYPLAALILAIGVFPNFLLTLLQMPAGLK